MPLNARGTSTQKTTSNPVAAQPSSQQTPHAPLPSSASASAPKDLKPGEVYGDALLTNDTLRLLKKPGCLTAPEIAKVRAAIAKEPKDRQPRLYRWVAHKVDYRNQRDNDGRYVEGDSMCNVTSLAMAMNGLGVGANEKNKQFEDTIDESLVQKGDGTRYDETGQTWIAEQRGLDVKRLYFGGNKGADGTKSWFMKEVLPRLEKGQSATMGVRFGSGYEYAHIVRLQWVDSDGLKVDDPFGELKFRDGRYAYENNDTKSAEGDGAKGENNLWSWKQVADVMGAKGDRYVQFLSA
jgi:hypothetical protein